MVFLVNRTVGSGFRRWFRRSALVLILAGGALFQSPCATTGAEIVGGISVSIANRFISNYLYDAFGLGNSLSSLLAT